MWRHLSLAGIGLLLALPPAALAERTVVERANMASGGVLHVSIVSGEVEISGWDREEVEVTGELDEGAELEFDVDGAPTRVRVVVAGGDHDDSDAYLVIRVPAATEVKVSVVSADIAIQGIRGRQYLSAVSGDIETELYDSDAEITAISGDVEIAGHDGNASLRLTLTSGDAEIGRISGRLAARTISGDLEIEAGTLSEVNLDTTSGTVELRMRLAAGGSLMAQSISGDVWLALCGEPDATFELSTFSGDIRTFADQEPQRTSRHGPGMQLRFSRGSGAGRISVETLSGDIELDQC